MNPSGRDVTFAFALVQLSEPFLKITFHQLAIKLRWFDKRQFYLVFTHYVYCRMTQPVG